MKHLRYYGQFYSADDTHYEIEINQESEQAYSPTEVEMSADALSIEWGEVEKLDPVRGSSASLRLIALYDRQFYDMYAVSYGEIELRVYRNGNIYWRGLLDPELFSEPFAYADNYEMELTFVDFAALEHIYWDQKGLVSIRSVIEHCKEAISLSSHPIEEIVSTEAVTSSGATISALDACISAENFYDEDGEPMTLREVLEEVLKPFSLQLTQKNGKVVVYDLNALHARPARRVEWYSNDQKLEADKVYNDITVKFSPYSDQTILKAEVDSEDDFSTENFAICAGYTDKAIAGPVDIGSTDPNTRLLTAYTLHYSNNGGTVGNMTAKNGAVFFRIEPVYSGSKEAGVLWSFSMGAQSSQADTGWKPNNNAKNNPENGNIFFADPSYLAIEPILSVPKFYAAADDRIRPDMLCVSLEMMYDARTNPFEEPDFFTDSDKSDYNILLDRGDYCYVPVKIYRCDADGTRTHYYVNGNTRWPNDLQNGWQPITYQTKYWPTYLCYYDENEDSTKGVMAGWVKNKRIVGKKTPSFSETFRRKNNGEYIPMPPVSGYIEIEVYPGVMFHYGSGNPVWNPNKVYKPNHGMIAYKSLEVSVVPSYGLDEVDQTDIEDIAWINPAARENLELSTIVGTPKQPMPTAKGVLRETGGAQIDVFTRAGHTDRIERLLIGTAYSQYAGRKNVISGSAVLLPDFTPITDEAIAGKYVVLSELQDLAKATSEVRMVEFSADEYEGIEEKKK